MQVEMAKNITTKESPITYQVIVRVSVLDMKDSRFESQIGIRIRKAIQGLEGE